MAPDSRPSSDVPLTPRERWLARVFYRLLRSAVTPAPGRTVYRVVRVGDRRVEVTARCLPRERAAPEEASPPTPGPAPPSAWWRWWARG